MNVTIYGAGYVGLVTAVCLAEIGHNVVCVEVNQEKLKNLQARKPTIYEEGLEALLISGLDKKLLRFSALSPAAVAHGEIQIIAVGTPSTPSGAVDMQYIEAAAKYIGQHLKTPSIIVNKSTVPVGTTDCVKKIIRENLKDDLEFHVVSNPEFLREGRAIQDFMNPERIIIGSDNEKATQKLCQLYLPLLQKQAEKFIAMKPRSAELTKYAANAFLAMKVSFINEIAEIAEHFSADIDEVSHGIGTDSRIGHQFLKAGCGFGGSCFPKDVNALLHMAGEKNIPADMLQSTLKRNQRQKQILFQKIHAYFNGNLKGKMFALWGLAFKPETDDVREASSLTLIDLLTKAGACIQAYDPMAMNNTKNHLHNTSNIRFCHSAKAAANDANALVIITEWDEFISTDLADIKLRLKRPIIFDGRNIYKQEIIQNNEFIYINIGHKPIEIPDKIEA